MDTKSEKSCICAGCKKKVKSNDTVVEVMRSTVVKGRPVPELVTRRVYHSECLVVMG